MHLRAVFPSGAIGEIEPTAGGASFITTSETANRTPRFKARLLREPQRGNGGNGRPRVYAPSSALYTDARPILSAFAISVAPTPKNALLNGCMPLLSIPACGEGVVR